jgi:hypothetical protein
MQGLIDGREVSKEEKDEEEEVVVEEEEEEEKGDTTRRMRRRKREGVMRVRLYASFCRKMQQQPLLLLLTMMLLLLMMMTMMLLEILLSANEVMKLSTFKKQQAFPCRHWQWLYPDCSPTCCVRSHAIHTRMHTQAEGTAT